MKKPLCIYHGNCFDGFTAAWAVKHGLYPLEIDFHEGHYGKPPPDVTDRDVMIVDFSYKRPVIMDILHACSTLLILDHHKTAAEDLAGFARPRPDWNQHLHYAGAPACSRLGVLFDMERSGAGLAWDFFHPGLRRHELVNHVEDRDLWRFKLPGTREIHAAMSAYPFTFDAWDGLMTTPVNRLASAGEGILRKHDRDVAVLVGLTQRTMIIGGYAVPVGNIAPQWVSDACHMMAKGERFSAAYYDGPDGRYFSLRSTDEGLDVSAIAAQYGGGGHRNAAGFKAERGWEGDREPFTAPKSAA